MGANVLVPAALRVFTEGKRAVTVQGDTVREALDSLTSQYPDLKRHLYDDDASLRGFVNIFVGSVNIRTLAGLDTPVTEGGDVSIVPAIAGGNRWN